MNANQKGTNTVTIISASLYSQLLITTRKIATRVNLIYILLSLLSPWLSLDVYKTDTFRAYCSHSSASSTQACYDS